VNNEHDTVLDEEGKCAPEFVVDNKLGRSRSLLDLPHIDSTKTKVKNDGDGKDDENDGSENLTTAHAAVLGLDIRNVLTATSRGVHEELNVAGIRLVDIIEEARVGVGLASHRDLGAVSARAAGALGTLRISDNDAVLWGTVLGNGELL